MPEHRTDCAHAEQPQVEYRIIPGQTNYRVGDDGSVWSCAPRNGFPDVGWRKLNPARNRDGYLLVSFSRRNKRRLRFVHVLVLEAFVGPRPEGFYCRHLNGNPQDNCLSNLCWGTPKENAADSIRHGTWLHGERAWRAKLTVEKVIEVRNLAAAGMSLTDIAKRLGVTTGAVQAIVCRSNWKHVPD